MNDFIYFSSNPRNERNYELDLVDRLQAEEMRELKGVESFSEFGISWLGELII